MGVILNKIVDEWLEAENTPKLLMKSTNRKVLTYNIRYVFVVLLPIPNQCYSENVVNDLNEGEERATLHVFQSLK